MFERDLVFGRFLGLRVWRNGFMLRVFWLRCTVTTGKGRIW